MNKNSKLLLLALTALLFAALTQVEGRKTYSSSSSRGRGSSSSSRGRTQSSSGGLFSSWFGGSKSSGSGSKSSSGGSQAKTNWQTATSHSSSSSKSGWANPYYKPSAPAVASAPKATNYGWKPAPQAGSHGASAYPSSNIGSRGYPVQSGIQQNGYGGFKPAPSLPSTNAAGSNRAVPSAPSTFNSHSPTSQSGFAVSKPISSAPQVPYNPASGVHNTGYRPSPSTYNTGYQPSSGYHPPASGHHPPQPPSYQASSFHHTGAYPQQSYPTFAHYPTQSHFGSSIPSYQGNKLFGGNSGHYGYSGSGNWGVPTYGASKSSGNTKLLTGLAVGAAGGYLTSSLVNRISNPWKYSGYGYGSGYGYSPSLGLGYALPRVHDESAFERGYERGFRQGEKNNQSPPAAVAPTPQEEDPSSKWIHCVAYDPQTQQTLINPNCSCTVVTSQDERTGQPISAHHCTTLNGLVMKPIPLGMTAPVGPAGNEPPMGGVNSPGVVPSYLNMYQEGGHYGGGAVVPAPAPPPEQFTKNADAATTNATLATPAETSTPGKITELTASTTDATVAKTHAGVTSEKIMLDLEPSQGVQKDEPKSSGLLGPENARKNTAEFYGKLQKIVNMGNFMGEV